MSRWAYGCRRSERLRFRFWYLLFFQQWILQVKSSKLIRKDPVAVLSWSEMFFCSNCSFHKHGFLQVFDIFQYFYNVWRQKKNLSKNFPYIPLPVFPYDLSPWQMTETTLRLSYMALTASVVIVRKHHGCWPKSAANKQPV